MTTTMEERQPALERLAEDIRAHHKAVERHMQAAVREAISAGLLLTKAKQELGHGRFTPWLRFCGVSERSARVYMRLAANRQRAAVLEADSIRAALEALAGPSRKPPAPLDFGPPGFRQSEDWERARYLEAMEAQGLVSDMDFAALACRIAFFAEAARAEYGWRR